MARSSSITRPSSSPSGDNLSVPVSSALSDLPPGESVVATPASDFGSDSGSSLEILPDLFTSQDNIFEKKDRNRWESFRELIPLPAELVTHFSGGFASRRSALPISLPFEAPSPHAIFYGLAYAPARFCSPHIRREIQSMAAFFHRHWNLAVEGPPPPAEAIATLLHGWRFVFHAVSPHLFPSDQFNFLSGSHLRGRLSLYSAARDCLSQNPLPRKLFRHFAGLLQRELEAVTVVPGGTLAPFCPTPFSRYHLLPSTERDWYYPVLFLTRSVARLESNRHPAQCLALLVGNDFVRLSPALIVTVGTPQPGSALIPHHGRHLQEMAAPLLTGASSGSPANSRSSANLPHPQIPLFQIPSPPSPPPPRRRASKEPSGYANRLRELEIAVQELVATPDRWSYELPLRNLSGQVLPPPRWAAEHFMGLALRTGQTTCEIPSLGLSASMDPHLGIVSINSGYMEYFSSPTVFSEGLWLSEPWAADVPVGPFRTLAQAIDLSVWEGKPHLTRQLLKLYPPAELHRHLPPSVWERWSVVSFWASHGLAEQPPTSSLLRYYRLRPTRRDRDLLAILRGICPDLDPESTVYLHTYQALAVARELRQRGRPDDAAAWTRRLLENRLRHQTASHRAGILEAAIQLHDYITRHAPGSRSRSTASARMRAAGWSSNPAVLTPPCLHRLESCVIGTRYEAAYAQMLSGFLEKLASHGRDIASVLAAFFREPTGQASAPTDVSPSSSRPLGYDGVFPALDALTWGRTAAEMLPEFLLHRIPSTSPAFFHDGFAAYLWRLHLLGTTPESLVQSLSYENECMHRLQTLEYHSTFNSVLMTLGTLELLRQSQQVRQSWLSAVEQAHEAGDVSQLLRLALLSPVIPLRHPDWARMWHQFCSSSGPGDPLSPAMSDEILRMLGAERSLGMVEPVIDTSHLPFRQYYPHEWFPHHRPRSYRLGGYHSENTSPSMGLPPYRHYPLLATR